MAKINPDKCFEQVALPVADVEAVEDNWLELLNTFIVDRSQHIELKQRNKLTKFLYKHAGPASTYTLKKELHEALQIIYKKLKSQNLSDDEKTAIYVKLVEDIGNCTPGFHDRVNEIVLGFIPTRTLSELLSRIRQGIVTNIAIKSTNEVHSYNRFFVVAQQLGYGIRPLNADDSYRGGFGDQKIITLLNNVFNDNFTLLSVAAEVEAELKRVLTTTLGYVGICARYTSSQYAKFIDYVKPFTDIEGGDLFVMNDDMTDVIGINFNNLRTAIINKLINDNYFTCSEYEERSLKMLAEGSFTREDIAVLKMSHLFENPRDLGLVIKMFSDLSKNQISILAEICFNSVVNIAEKINIIERLPYDCRYDLIMAKGVYGRSLFSSVDINQKHRLVKACPAVLIVMKEADKDYIFLASRHIDNKLFEIFTTNIELFSQYYSDIPSTVTRNVMLKRYWEDPKNIIKIFRLLSMENKLDLLTTISSNAAFTNMNANDAKIFFGEIYEALTMGELKQLFTLLGNKENTISFSCKYRPISYLLQSMISKTHEPDQFIFLQSRIDEKSLAEHIADYVDSPVGRVFNTSNIKNEATETHIKIYNAILYQLKHFRNSEREEIKDLLKDLRNTSTRDEFYRVIQDFYLDNRHTQHKEFSRKLVMILPENKVRLQLKSETFMKIIEEANNQYCLQEVANKRGRFFKPITKPKHQQDFTNLINRVNSAFEECKNINIFGKDPSIDKEAVRKMLSYICSELNKQIQKLQPKHSFRCFRGATEQKFVRKVNSNFKHHHYSRLLVALIQKAHESNLFEYSGVPIQFSTLLNTKSITDIVDFNQYHLNSAPV